MTPSRRGVPRARYVNEAEKASQTLARQQLWQVAYEAATREWATPASQESPFLAYHACCPRQECEMSGRSIAGSFRRAAVITAARLSVYLSRA
jgi:hypothetical protein